MINPLNFAMQMIQNNPNIANNPQARHMVEVIQSGNAENLAQSQANQTQTLIDRLRPCPEPAYITCNPWATNGTAYNGCCNAGYNGGCC